MKRIKSNESLFLFQYNTCYISRLELISPLIAEKVNNVDFYKGLFLTDTIQSLKDENKVLTDTSLKKSTDSKTIAKINSCETQKHTKSIKNNHNSEFIESSDKSNRKLVIIATVFLVSDLKPSVFDEIKTIKDLKPVQKSDTYYKKEVKYFIEDIKGRVEIDVEHPNLKDIILSTGMVLGFIGLFDLKGKFIVEDIIFPGPLTHDDKKINKLEISKKAYNIGFLSRLKMDINNNIVKLKIIIDYVNNVFVDANLKETEKENNQLINELFVFGDLFSHQCTPKIISEISKLNEFVSYSGLKVTFIPSINDPTTKLFPQENFHEKIFIGSKSLTNPCIHKIQNKVFLFTSGENIKDLLKYKKEYSIEQNKVNIIEKTDLRPGINFYSLNNDNKSYFDAMELVLKTCYISPTSPDTLKCIPYCKENDPFFIGDLVIDYFVVPGPEFGVKKLDNGTVLIILPEFNKNTEVVVFDIISNKYHTIQFQDQQA